MGTLYSSYITVYRASSWSEGSSHGGNISNVVITSGSDQSVFDDVSNAERVAGDIEYRKIYIHNGNATEWTTVKCWISTNSSADNDDIYICAGGKSSFQGQTVLLKPGVGIFQNGSTTVTGTGTYFTKDVAVGEVIYNATNDTVASGVAIASITSNTSLTLSSNYGGTGGSSKDIGIAPITHASIDWVQPSSISSSDVLSLGTLDLAGNTSYKGIWIKRVVTAGIANGYKNNLFVIAFGGS